MSIKSEFDELWDLKLKIESQSFQKYLVKPIKDELYNLKASYDCKTLAELATQKGKYQGLMFFIDLLKEANVKIKNLKDELEQNN